MAAGPAPMVICGPSGVGKSVLIKKLLEVFPGRFGFSVSHTTRGPRPGEEDGVAYHFTDMEAMQRGVEEGRFIEHAHVHGNMYGTSREAVEAVRRSGQICILDIDVQGAKSIHEQGLWDGTRFIFINPPSHEELERRLRGRGTETEEKIQKRLGNAMGEIEFSNRVSFFDHKFILDGLVGDNTPENVLDLILLLKSWYPSLEGMAPHVGILKDFRRVHPSGVMPRDTLEEVLRGVIGQAGQTVTDKELASMLRGCGDRETVDYQAFVKKLFTSS